MKIVERFLEKTSKIDIIMEKLKKNVYVKLLNIYEKQNYGKVKI